MYFLDFYFLSAINFPPPIFTISPQGPIKINGTVTINCSMETRTEFMEIDVIFVVIDQIKLIFCKFKSFWVQYRNQIPRISFNITPTGVLFKYEVPFLLNQKALCTVYRIYPLNENTTRIDLVLWSAYNILAYII